VARWESDGGLKADSLPQVRRITVKTADGKGDLRVNGRPVQQNGVVLR